MFRNFAGKEGRYNAEGRRNFCVALPEDVAAAMEKDGWNVKYLQPREDGDSPQAYLKVSISYSPRARPPRVVMVTSRGKTPLGEKEVDLLDWAVIEKADLIIRGWDYSSTVGSEGVAAYLQSLFVRIEEDELELKYADVPDSAMESVATSHLAPWED